MGRVEEFRVESLELERGKVKKLMKEETETDDWKLKTKIKLKPRI